MGKPTDWKQNGLALIGLAVGVLFAAVLGIVSFLNATSTTVHQSAQDVPTVMQGTPSPKWASAVEHTRQLVRANVVEQNLPGLSVAVGLDHDIVWAEGFGWADLENRVRVTPSTRFRIGHASKPLTSAAVGLLLEQGRLHLNDEIHTYVPTFPRKQWPITLRQLMGHVAGVGHYETDADYMPSAHCERASDGLQRLGFGNDPLRFEPDTQYRYSTFGWILVSAAVEAAANEPFFAFMRKRVFTPLGMTDTTSDSTTESTELATFYYPRFSGDPGSGPELATDVDYSCFAGAGAFLSTPSDLVRFGLAMNGRLPPGFGAQGGRLLQPDTVKKLQTRQLLASGEETEYGLGWTLETFPLAGKPTLLASHASRTLLGGSTSFLTFPDRALVVAVTTNISKADTRSIALRIAEAFAERK